MGKGKTSLKPYKYTEFAKILHTLGFFEHHKNSTHMVFAASDGRYVTVPFGSREINSMMCTVTLQRIKNGNCRYLGKGRNIPGAPVS